MKKFIPQKTEEIKELSEEQQTKEISPTDKWEKWGFTKQNSGEETSQKTERLNTKKYTITDKSDIIISLDEKFAQPIEKREKTYEFRKYTFFLI